MIDKASAGHFGCWEWQTSGYMGIVGVLSWVFREGKKSGLTKLRENILALLDTGSVRLFGAIMGPGSCGAGASERRPRTRCRTAAAIVCVRGELSHRHGVARLRYTELMDMQPGWMGTVKRWGRVSQR